MNSADLITSFFNNELSPDQERQFLLSVASSDSMRLGLKSHVMLDRILQEENQETAIAPTTRRMILREAAAVAALAGGAAQQAAAAERSEPSVPTSSGLHFPAWGTAALSLLVAVGSFFAGFTLGESSDSDPVAVADSPADQVATAQVEVDPLRSVLEWIDLEEMSARPVRIVAEQLQSPTGDLSEVDAAEEPAVTAAGIPTASASQTQGSGAAAAEGDEDEPASTSTADGQGDPGSPSTVSSGNTTVKKRNRNN